jgi:hypothetical protein
MKTGETEGNQPAVDWLGHRRERRPLRRSAFRQRTVSIFGLYTAN